MHHHSAVPAHSFPPPVAPPPILTNPVFLYHYMYTPHMYGTPSPAYIPFPQLSPQIPASHATTPSYLPHTHPSQANAPCISSMVQAETRWFPDSGATNHLTNATPAPPLTTSYTGSSKVLVAPISNSTLSGTSPDLPTSPASDLPPSPNLSFH